MNWIKVKDKKPPLNIDIVMRPIGMSRIAVSRCKRPYDHDKKFNPEYIVYEFPGLKNREGYSRSEEIELKDKDMWFELPPIKLEF